MTFDLASCGFSILERVLTEADRMELLAELGPVKGAGRRGLLSLPTVAKLASSEKWLSLLRPYLPAEPSPVRTIYFDKSPATNWLVAWHQDLTLAVNERQDIAGFGPWSVKEGIPHVQPPEELLQQMLTIRLHLDDTDETNGALRVLPGSHLAGRLSSEQIQTWRERQQEVVCAVPECGAMLMRPLLLHASGRSTSQRRRRVLHIEYAAFDLPSGLQWHEGPP